VTLTEVVGRPNSKLGVAVSTEAVNYLCFRSEDHGGGSARVSLEGNRLASLHRGRAVNHRKSVKNEWRG
jgi:hypothetical protein